MTNKSKIKFEKIVEMSNQKFEDKMNNIKVLQEKLNTYKKIKIVEMSNQKFEDKMNNIKVLQEKLNNYSTIKLS